MRDKEAEKRHSRRCIARTGLPGQAGLQWKQFRKDRKPKMKTNVWFEKNLPKAETGVQNGVFLQRR